MEKDKETVLVGIKIRFLDGTTETFKCKAYGLGAMGLSLFNTGSPSIDLAGNHLHTFVYANIVGYEVLWKEE